MILQIILYSLFNFHILKFNYLFIDKFYEDITRYDKDHSHKIGRIKDEKERKLYHIDQNHKENKASLSGLIFETEKALEDRLNIIKETKKNFRDKVRDLEYHIGELKITLDDLKLENKRNDQHIIGVINANNKSEYTYKCLSEEYKRNKHENDKLKNTNSNLK